MAVVRLDNVAIVVEDLESAIAFFEALGLKLESTAQIEGPWADQTVGLTGVRSTIAWLRTPDGHNALELTQYHAPPPVHGEPSPPPANTIGLHRVMFAVDDIDDTVARLAAHGGEVVDRVVDYEGVYRLCYVRGPAGVIVALAQQVGAAPDAGAS